MKIESVHPGTTLEEVQDNTGFDLIVPETVPETPIPTSEELKLLREVIDPDGFYIGKD